MVAICPTPWEASRGVEAHSTTDVPAARAAEHQCMVEKSHAAKNDKSTRGCLSQQNQHAPVRVETSATGIEFPYGTDNWEGGDGNNYLRTPEDKKTYTTTTIMTMKDANDCQSLPATGMNMPVSWLHAFDALLAENRELKQQHEAATARLATLHESAQRTASQSQQLRQQLARSSAYAYNALLAENCELKRQHDATKARMATLEEACKANGATRARLAALESAHEALQARQHELAQEHTAAPKHTSALLRATEQRLVAAERSNAALCAETTKLRQQLARVARMASTCGSKRVSIEPGSGKSDLPTSPGPMKCGTDMGSTPRRQLGILKTPTTFTAATVRPAPKPGFKLPPELPSTVRVHRKTHMLHTLQSLQSRGYGTISDWMESMQPIPKSGRLLLQEQGVTEHDVAAHCVKLHRDTVLVLESPPDDRACAHGSDLAAATPAVPSSSAAPPSPRLAQKSSVPVPRLPPARSPPPLRHTPGGQPTSRMGEWLDALGCSDLRSCVDSSADMFEVLIALHNARMRVCPDTVRSLRQTAGVTFDVHAHVSRVAARDAAPDMIGDVGHFVDARAWQRGRNRAAKHRLQES